MTLNRVADLRRVGGLRYNFDTEHPTLLDIETVDSVRETEKAEREMPQFGLKWKIFELNGCDGAGKVCLVFPPKAEGSQVDDTGNLHVDIVPPEPQVWFLDRAFEWHFLAQDFPTYFRQLNENTTVLFD